MILSVLVLSRRDLSSLMMLSTTLYGMILPG